MIKLDPVKKSVIDEKNAKDARDAAIESVEVVTSSGKIFDGDRAARQALTSAVAVGNPGETVAWKMADNSIQTVSYEELKEALRLVGEAHTAIITG